MSELNTLELRKLPANDDDTDLWTWMLYEKREMARMDFESLADKARADGLAEGIEQGLAEGRVAVARNQLTLNLPLEQIITATGLNREEIEALR